MTETFLTILDKSHTVCTLMRESPRLPVTLKATTLQEQQSHARIADSPSTSKEIRFDHCNTDKNVEREKKGEK